MSSSMSILAVALPAVPLIRAITLVLLPLDVIASAHYFDSSGCGSTLLHLFVLYSNMTVVLDSLMFFFDPDHIDVHV